MTSHKHYGNLLREKAERTMFVPIKELGDEGLIIGSLLHGIIAIEIVTEAELHGTRAHSKRGNPDHYFVSALNGGTTIDYTDQHPTLNFHKSKVFGLRAYSKAEAIARANQLMPGKWAKFLRQEYHVERSAIFWLPETAIATRALIQQFSAEYGAIQSQQVTGAFQILQDNRPLSVSWLSPLLDLNETHNAFRVTFEDYNARLRGTGWLRAAGPCKLFITCRAEKSSSQ